MAKIPENGAGGRRAGVGPPAGAKACGAVFYPQVFDFKKKKLAGRVEGEPGPSGFCANFHNFEV